MCNVYTTLFFISGHFVFIQKVIIIYRYYGFIYRLELLFVRVLFSRVYVSTDNEITPLVIAKFRAPLKLIKS